MKNKLLITCFCFIYLVNITSIEITTLKEYILPDNIFALDFCSDGDNILISNLNQIYKSNNREFELVYTSKDNSNILYMNISQFDNNILLLKKGSFHINYLSIYDLEKLKEFNLKELSQKYDIFGEIFFIDENTIIFDAFNNNKNVRLVSTYNIKTNKEKIILEDFSYKLIDFDPSSNNVLLYREIYTNGKLDFECILYNLHSKLKKQTEAMGIEDGFILSNDTILYFNFSNVIYQLNNFKKFKEIKTDYLLRRGKIFRGQDKIILEYYNDQSGKYFYSDVKIVEN